MKIKSINIQIESLKVLSKFLYSQNNICSKK